MTGRRGWSRVRGSSPTIMETSSPWVRTMIVYLNGPMIRRAKMINDVICWFQLFLTTGSICGWQPPWCWRAGQGRWRGQPHPSSLASSVICHNQHPCETWDCAGEVWGVQGGQAYQVYHHQRENRLNCKMKNIVQWTNNVKHLESTSWKMSLPCKSSSYLILPNMLHGI